MRLSFPHPPLSGGHIVLRYPSGDDVRWIAEACGDRDLSRYVPAMPYPYSLADARTFVERAARDWVVGNGAVFVIAHVDTGDGLGMIGLHLSRADPGLAEVGYWLCRYARGRGAATAAVRLVTGWAFGELGIERLQLTTAPENLASQRVAERAGFTREGVLRAWTPAADGRRDSVMFSLLPSEVLGG